MPRRPRTARGAFLLVFLALCRLSCSVAWRLAAVAILNDIPSVLAALEDAWNQSDAAACARLFAPDASYVTRSGAVWKGRPAIEAGFARAFTGSFADTTLWLHLTDLAFPAGLVAIAHVNVHLISGEEPAIRAVSTFVFGLEDDQWIILAGHTSDLTTVH